VQELDCELRLAWSSVRRAVRKTYGGLSGVVEPEEQQFGVFVRQT